MREDDEEEGGGGGGGGADIPLSGKADKEEEEEEDEVNFVPEVREDPPREVYGKYVSAVVVLVVAVDAVRGEEEGEGEEEEQEELVTRWEGTTSLSSGRILSSTNLYLRFSIGC